MSHTFYPTTINGGGKVVCGEWLSDEGRLCAATEADHLPTIACTQCGTRIALDPALTEWSCPICGRRYVRDRGEAR